VVEDLESANGTFINGKPIQRARLKDGDRLRIAEHEFLVRLQGLVHRLRPVRVCDRGRVSLSVRSVQRPDE